LQREPAHAVAAEPVALGTSDLPDDRAGRSNRRTSVRRRGPSSALYHPGRCRRVRVLDLDPIGRAPGAIRPVDSLRHDAFKAHSAGVLEHGLAVRAVEMFGEPNAGARLAQEPSQGRTPDFPQGCGRISSPSRASRSKAKRNTSREPARPANAECSSKSVTPRWSTTTASVVLDLVGPARAVGDSANESRKAGSTNLTGIGGRDGIKGHSLNQKGCARHLAWTCQPPIRPLGFDPYGMQPAVRQSLKNLISSTVSAWDRPRPRQP